jgi:hypothetical protein
VPVLCVARVDQVKIPSVWGVVFTGLTVMFLIDLVIDITTVNTKFMALDAAFFVINALMAWKSWKEEN